MPRALTLLGALALLLSACGEMPRVPPAGSFAVPVPTSAAGATPTPDPTPGFSVPPGPRWALTRDFIVLAFAERYGIIFGDVPTAPKTGDPYILGSDTTGGVLVAVYGPRGDEAASQVAVVDRSLGGRIGEAEMTFALYLMEPTAAAASWLRDELTAAYANRVSPVAHNTDIGTTRLTFKAWQKATPGTITLLLTPAS